MGNSEDDALRHPQEAFAEGYLAGRAGLPGDLTVIQTADGPVEGRRQADRITFTFPDGRVLEVRPLPGGNLEAYMDGRLVARVADDEEDAPRPPSLPES